MDVSAALDELHRSSLVEFSTGTDGEQYVSVPLSAALFGRRKQATSSWTTAVDADIEVLQLFGAASPRSTSGPRSLDGQVERLFRAVAARVQRDPDTFNVYLPVLEYVSREHPLGWCLLARLLEEQRPSPRWAEEAVDAYRAYLERHPAAEDVWRALAGLSARRGDYLGQVQALVERARIPDASYGDVSYAANEVNAALSSGRVRIDTEEKGVLLGALAELMLDRLAEADATDLSRLAWLLLQLGRDADARDVVLRGLRLDPANSYCLKLAKRLDVAVA
jgi:tetratricopeptide (TPR) repeat protein